MLHESKIQEVLEKADRSGKRMLYDIGYVTTDGEKIELKGVFLTSSRYRPRTYTVKLPNGEFRTIRHILIVSINQTPVYV